MMALLVLQLHELAQVLVSHGMVALLAPHGPLDPGLVLYWMVTPLVLH